MSQGGGWLGGEVCCEGARPSETKGSEGSVVAFRLLLKAGPEYVSSSLVGAGAT